MPMVNILLGFILISLYISLQFCMLEVNQIVLPGHMTITDYSTGSYVWGMKPKKVSIIAGGFRTC
jgi:hypothetical protein